MQPSQMIIPTVTMVTHQTPAYSDQPRTREKRNLNRPMILGILHVINSVILFGLGMALLIEHHESATKRLLVTLPLIGFLVFVCTGVLSISISLKKHHPFFYIAHNVLAVLSLVLSALTTVTSGYGTSYYACKDDCQYSNRNLPKQLSACLLIFGLFECVLALCSIAYGFITVGFGKYHPHNRGSSTNEASEPSYQLPTNDVTNNPSTIERDSSFTVNHQDTSLVTPQVETANQFQMVTTTSGQKFILVPLENMQEMSGNFEHVTTASGVILPPYSFTETPPPYSE